MSSSIPAPTRAAALLLIPALLFAGSCGGGSTSTSSSTSPTAPQSVTVGASTSGAAIVGVTRMTFTVSVVNPGSDPLTYRWTFGDGGTAEGATVTHVFTQEGEMPVRVKVESLRTGMGTGASLEAGVTVRARTITGTWVDLNPIYVFDFIQRDAQVGGNLRGGLSIAGTLSDPRGISVQFQGYTDTCVFRGTVEETLDKMRLQLERAQNGTGGCGSVFNLTRR